MSCALGTTQAGKSRSERKKEFRSNFDFSWIRAWIAIRNVVRKACDTSLPWLRSPEIALVKRVTEEEGQERESLAGTQCHKENHHMDIAAWAHPRAHSKTSCLPSTITFTFSSLIFGTFALVLALALPFVKPVVHVASSWFPGIASG